MVTPKKKLSHQPLHEIGNAQKTPRGQERSLAKIPKPTKNNNSKNNYDNGKGSFASVTGMSYQYRQSEHFAHPMINNCYRRQINTLEYYRRCHKYRGRTQ